MHRLSLTWKIFIGTAFVVAAVLAATLALTARKATTTADASVDNALRATREQATSYLQARARTLRGGAEVFVQNPNFRSLVQKRDLSSMLDQSQVAASQLEARWVQITDADGVRMAKSDDPSAAADTLAGSRLISRALEGSGAQAFIVIGDSVLAQAVTVPIEGAAENAAPIGVLMAVTPLDTTVAAAIKRAAQGGADVVFFMQPQAGAPRVFASTLGRSAALDAFIHGLPKAADVDPETPDSTRNEVVRANPHLGNVHYVALAQPLRSASGSVYGGVVILRDRDAEFAAFNQLRNTIVFGGLAGLLIAGLLSFMIARQITKPVAELVQATRRAADGDYAADIQVRGTDEIGTLATAFRAMLGDLREKQALVDFLSGSVPGEAATVQMAQMRPSMQQAVQEAGITPGSRFAVRYDVKEVLGVGGMGTVFRAMDTELGEVIAIKTLKQDFLARDPSALERFKSEIRLARRISHRNVVRTHDLGEHSGVYFITMEYVEGKSLKQLIRERGTLPVAVALTVGKQLCRALEVAHEQGVIHRDIKPQNMVVEADGVLKVMDFGIARLAASDSGMTQAGMIVGTPEYMAPEQLMGQDVDVRADIYAAGCVLYECLTGHKPVEADNAITLIARLLEETPKPPSAWNPEVPPALDVVVMQALAKDRTERPATAAALHDLLAAIG